MDIINLGFVNIFPDQGVAGWPGSNFGNQCDGTYYTVGNLTTELLKGCHQLVEDIPICQAAGKKVFLSLGGAYPATQQILSEDSANNFADFLWGAFGPKTDDWVSNNGPRPFGDVVVDGFDFDIEHNGNYGRFLKAPQSSKLTSNVSRLRNNGQPTEISLLLTARSYLLHFGCASMLDT